MLGTQEGLLQVKPMDYRAFCDACHLDPAGMELFNRFAMVGGIPKYWELVDPNQSADTSALRMGNP